LGKAYTYLSMAQYVVALFDYQGTDEAELSMKKGDRIKVIKKDDGGWWQGELKGKTGLFPCNYTEQEVLVSDKGG